MKKYSLRGEVIPFELEKPDGTTETLELREMKSSVRDKHLQAMGDRAKFNAQGQVIGIKNLIGLHSDLLTLCIYRGDEPVKAEEIQSWPSSLTSELYKEAQRINHLNATADEAKADSKKD